MPKVIAQSRLKRGEGVAFWVGVTIFLAGIVARQLDVIIKHYLITRGANAWNQQSNQIREIRDLAGFKRAIS